MDNSLSSPSAHQAVVIGASLTGLLAASVLADHADKVIIVESDGLPAGPAPRRGMPQARHAHILLSGGARAMESLLPGIQTSWVAQGARRMSVPTDLVALTPHGWLRREPEMQYQIVGSRDLLDSVTRQRVLAHPRITTLPHRQAVGLLGDRQKVHGLQIRNPDGSLDHLTAALVVDASGRRSHTPTWLTDIGLPRVQEEVVDPGLVYATRLFRAPAGGEQFPIVNVQADPAVPAPGRTATLIAIENGQWLVTLSGTRGGEPTSDPEQFESFARMTRHPLVADLIARAEPLSKVYVTRTCTNTWRHYERLPTWPTGLVVLGDAVAAYNPVYGQGMTVAAGSAAALRGILRRHGLNHPHLARRVQLAVSRVAQGPWAITTGEDIRFPGVAGRSPTRIAKAMHAYVDRLAHTATGRSSTCRALFDVMTLSTPLTRLFSPSIVLGALFGPRKPPLTEPPLSEGERAIGGLQRAMPAP
ncbi:pyridine nucleotide-disulfide oxidoreductase [Streptomyces sp. ET3-23]|uniref:FAD-dependent oxidoreductase n=1 Tax=Streptomyces sp. ET3-23 TaxID=2885643 RepID=UPI001D0F58B1|nr:FAD-dependent oxidoreductase [Streptomyces sp. ET3-23]MCC2280851.1 pyridine nucleotide-disulfide oxidoreductase [Streptomyces sp. ET3-23]